MHLYFSKNVEQTFINGFIFTAKLRIGVTEKGYLTLELEVNGTPGHSSVPPKETAIGILAPSDKKIRRRTKLNARNNQSSD